MIKPGSLIKFSTNHEINQFCSSHSLQEVYIDKFDELDDSLKEALQNGCNKYAPGIEIIAVRVTKPRIPSDIASNYEKMEMEKTKLLISKEAAKVKAKETETEKMMEKIRAETTSSISQIEMEEKILLKEGKQKVETIENEINLEKQKTIAEVDNYRRLKEIDINQKKLTKEFIYFNAISNIKNIHKNYYGENIPKYLEENLSILPEPKLKAPSQAEKAPKQDSKKENIKEI